MSLHRSFKGFLINAKKMDHQPILHEEKISRPMNSFMLYKRDKKHAILAANPGINFREVSKLVADSWKNEDPEVKKQYSCMAAEESRAHKQKYPHYKYPSSIGKKKKKEIISKSYRGVENDNDALLSMLLDSSYSEYNADKVSKKKQHLSLIQLNTNNIGQTAAIPNSPKDTFPGTLPFTNTLLSPISFSFERDPVLNSFFSSWDYSQFSQGSRKLKSTDKNKNNIQSSLAAHIPGQGFSANL